MGMRCVTVTPRIISDKKGQNGQRMKNWQVQEAKAHFGALVRSVEIDGPQTITVHGRRAAVVLSADDYNCLKRPQPSMAEFLRAASLVGVDLDIERDKSL